MINELLRDIEETEGKNVLKRLVYYYYYTPIYNIP